MRIVAFFFAAGLTFGAVPFLLRMGPVPFAIVLVALAVLLSVAASGALGSATVAFGAAGAFAAGNLFFVIPAVAGAVLAALCFGERSLRVKGREALALHVVLALLGGGLAGALTSAYSDAAFGVRAVAVVVSSLLLCLPFLVPCDDRMAHALEAAARRCPGAVASSLVEAAELRRSVIEVDLGDEKALHRIHGTWRALLRLGEARARLSRVPAGRAPGAASTVAAVIEKIDARIVDHVSALRRAYVAVSTVEAAEMSVDDRALRSAESVGETLDEVSKALVEAR